MKKVVSGASLLIAGALLFLSASVAGSLNMQSMNGWDTYIGRFWTSIAEGRLMPLVVISGIAMAVGVALMAWGIWDKKDTK